MWKGVLWVYGNLGEAVNEAQQEISARLKYRIEDLFLEIRTRFIRYQGKSNKELHLLKHFCQCYVVIFVCFRVGFHSIVQLLTHKSVIDLFIPHWFRFLCHDFTILENIRHGYVFCTELTFELVLSFCIKECMRDIRCRQLVWSFY